MSPTWVPKTIPEMLLHRAEQAPDAPLLRQGDDRRTGAQMVAKVARAAGALQAQGITAGDRVLLMAGNRLDALDLVMACSWIGAIAAPINTAARGEQLAHIMNNCDPSMVVAEAKHIPTLRGADVRLGTPYWTLGAEAVEGASPLDLDGDEVAPAAVRPGDPTAILYTSGTTGLSKGVLCPQAQFYWWGVNVSRQLGITSEDVLHSSLPLFHTNALNAFSQAMVSGAEYCLSTRFSASRFWSELKAEGATVTYVLGAMVTILANRAPSEEDRDHQVRVALAPATPPHLLGEFRRRFGVELIDGWGSTETNSVINVGQGQDRPGSMGRTWPGFHTRVVDSDGTPVSPGPPGELLVRSEQPYAFALGYHKMSDATVTAWNDLWFHSGDRVVEDEAGWFKFIDRIKDVIRRRGENISSLEVETALLQHPRISQVAVYGVPSELGEEEVMATIVMADEELTPEELVAFCRDRLAYYAIPRFVRFADELPVTENGKVRKAALRDLGREGADWDREALGLRVGGQS